MLPAKHSSIFGYAERTRQISSAISASLEREMLTRRRKYILAKNEFRYRHGSQWTATYITDDSSTDLVSAEAFSHIRYSEIVRHDEHLIQRYVGEMADQFEKTMFEDLVRVMGNVTTKTGNVVRSSGDIQSDMIEMLQLIQLGTDELGHVSYPSIIAHPKAAEKLLRAIDPAREEEMEAIFATREKEAIAKEASRLTRYRFA